MMSLLTQSQRRETLLVDMQHRHKVGGILDQRFGESDPTMTPEEKAMERFAREQMRSHKKSSMFDLEDDDDDDDTGGLTHGGKALQFDAEPEDDFVEDMGDDDDENHVSELDQQRRKRLRAMNNEGEEEEEQPERKKSKKEVMEEIIAKSKMGKYERQQKKEEDDDLRMEIDQDLPELQRLLAGGQKRHGEDSPHAAIAGVDRTAFDKNYDLQVRKLAQDRRAQPTERTKTDEEKAEDEQNRLKELEEKRQKRMRGEPVTDSEDEGDDKESEVDFEDDVDGDDDFGLGSGIQSQKKRPSAAELGFDDEDDFIIDDNLVFSGSDVDSLDDMDEEEDEDEDGSDAEEASEDDDDEFTKGLLNEEEARNPIFQGTAVKDPEVKKGDEHGLPFTFPCPQTLEDFSKIARQHPLETLPTIIIRIRTLYHPRLDSKNKERLGVFATVLIDFVSSPFGATQYDADVWPSIAVLESIMRHIQSLAKMFPIEIARQCRLRLEEIGKERPLALKTGDLMLLTLVGAVFPTSDHFHKVVTPAMVTIGRYLGQKVPHTLADHSVGVSLSILSVDYQQLSKRYIPEAFNFLLHTISALSPTAVPKKSTYFPMHTSDPSLRIENAGKLSLRKLNFLDCVNSKLGRKGADELKVVLLASALQVFDAAAKLWANKSSFADTAEQVLVVLKHFGKQKNRAHFPPALCEHIDKLQSKLERMLRLASLSRRPLELHHHRPLAIKRYIPKFEENFDPDKHYDPDRERAELAKLKKEHKKERKGAMRELRKDANFMAREKLKIKVAKEAAHEKKMNRIVAEIQNEEGREANEYEREKKARKRSRNR